MPTTTRLASTVAALLAIASGQAFAVDDTAIVAQGGVARWAGGDAKECGIFGRRYGAIDGICYYPVDMKATPGRTEIARWDHKGARTLGTLSVVERACADTAITLTDETYVEVSAANKARGVEERARLAKAVAGAAGEPRFALPIGLPASGVVPAEQSDFCELRIYNGGRVKSRHTGLDFPLAQGTPVVAGAIGTVALAEEQFYTGNTVVVDHGGGLVTMAFHLADIAVEAGTVVRRGELLGSVGTSGRSTGPHLHYGARYQGQRIDVGALIGDPAMLPGVGEALAQPAVNTTATGVDSDPGAGAESSGEGVTPENDVAVENPEAAGQSGDPEAADAVEPKEDVLEQEAAEQEAADEAARLR